MIAVTLATTSARADTFGVQVHGMRSKGRLDGDSVSSSGDKNPRLPDSIDLASDGEIVGADVRFDLLFDRVRVGAAVAFFGVRDLRLDPASVGSHDHVTFDDGAGASSGLFGGYELLRGPVYLYADLRVMLQGFGGAVKLEDKATGETSSTDYGKLSVGAGPRLGMLVPVGHSLMIDVAVYQGALGGLEGTTAFVGLGYWENDRNDPFTDRLKGSFGGDF